MVTTSQILAAIQPFLTESNKVNPNTPLLTSYGTGPIYIYRLPGTNPQVLVYTSSGAIDCDGITTSQCSITTDPSYYPDTAFHTSTDQPLDASTLPFYVLPIAGSQYFDYSVNNIAGGQLGLAIYGNNMNFGVLGDENADAQATGEISYAMASSLGIDPDPNNGGIETGVTYILFTGSSNIVNPIENHSLAASMGNNALNTMLSQISSVTPPPGGTTPPPGGKGEFNCSPLCTSTQICLLGTCVEKKYVTYAAIGVSALFLLSILKK